MNSTIEALLTNTTVAMPVRNESGGAMVNPCPKFVSLNHRDTKLYISAYFGTTISLISILENLFTLFVIVRSKTLRKTPFYYMMWLAVTDIVLGITYLCLMSAMAVFMYYEVVWLHDAWFSYERVLFTINHVMNVAAGYLIVAETIERFSGFFHALSGLYRFLRRRRWLMVIVVYAWALLNRGIMYFEIRVVERENCTGMSRYRLQMASFNFDPIYSPWIKIYLRSMISPVLPFLVLATMNMITIICDRRRYSLRRPETQLSVEDNNNVSMSGASTTTAGQTQASSPRMFLLLVVVWLGLHTLGTGITLMEMINKSFLLRHIMVWSTITEVVNLLTVISGCIRLPIYIWCNKQFSHAAKHVVRWLPAPAMRSLSMRSSAPCSRLPSTNTRLLLVRNAHCRLSKFESEAHTYQVTKQLLASSSTKRRHYIADEPRTPFGSKKNNSKKRSTQQNGRLPTTEDGVGVPLVTAGRGGNGTRSTTTTPLDPMDNHNNCHIEMNHLHSDNRKGADETRGNDDDDSPSPPPYQACQRKGSKD